MKLVWETASHFPLLTCWLKSVYFFQGRQGSCLKKSTHQAPSRPPAMRPPTSARTDNIRGIPGGNMFHQNLFLFCSGLPHQSSQTGDRKADPQMFLRQNFHNLEELRNLLDQDQVWDLSWWGWWGRRSRTGRSPSWTRTPSTPSPPPLLQPHCTPGVEKYFLAST